MGVRLAGLTYNRKNYIGDGLYERNDGGLSDFGIEVVHRMNALGTAVDLSHASFRTAMDAIEFSAAPVVFSHNAAYTLSPNPPKDTDGRREDSGRGWVRELQGRWPGVLG